MPPDRPLPVDSIIDTDGTIYWVDPTTWNDGHTTSESITGRAGVTIHGVTTYFDTKGRLRIQPPGYGAPVGAVLHNSSGPAITDGKGVYREWWVDGQFVRHEPGYTIKPAAAEADGYIVTSTRTGQEYRVPRGAMPVIAEEYEGR